MAISNHEWAKAKAMFEAGSSLADIAKKVDIEKSTISKKSKQQGWLKGINQQLIADEVRLSLEKSTLNEHQLSHHEQVVEYQLALKKDIEQFSQRTMKKANTLMNDTKTGHEFKAIIEGVDKLSLLNNINDRHPKKDMPEAAHQRRVSEIKIIRAQKQDAISEALSELAYKLPD